MIIHIKEKYIDNENWKVEVRNSNGKRMKNLEETFPTLGDRSIYILGLMNDANYTVRG